MTDLSPGHWAARYAASDLAVLPLHTMRDGRCTCRRDCGRNAGKHPLVAHGKDDASYDPQQVTGWWTRWPWANIGIRPPVGTVVLDVDPRHGGSTALLELTRQHGQLPPTLTARTGSGGLHIWLAYSGRTRGQLCPGVDVKASTGYVVAPPSVHASGRRYEWITGLPTAPAPRWVRQLLDPPAPVPLTRREPAGSSADRLVKVVAEAAEGERNRRLYWAACRAHESGMDPTPLLDAAVAVGLTESGARATIASAAKAPPRVGATRR